MLEKIKGPSDLKNCSYGELTALAGELRDRIKETVSECGGHLASNLGMVEATIALHRVFDSPEDTIVFDVGHQCYAHKLLTGRADTFSTLRRFGGLSGFPSPPESEHDSFYAGHCGASLSAALGVAVRNQLQHLDRYVIAVIGDAAFSNGMVFEAMNDCARRDLNLIILLNDNTMSISKNVGGLSSHLSKMRTSESYFAFKHSLQSFLGKIPIIGGRLRSKTRNMKDRLRRALLGDSVFECMGLDYLGPVDGHDIKKLESVLREAKTKNRTCLVHMVTEKGRGYAPSEVEPEAYHAVGPFDTSVGIEPRSGETFSSVFGDIMCRRAAEDDRLCAITAAMCVGTGLDEFTVKYRDRFFDVGIEEEHAAAFAGGLGAAGMTPVFAVYSTFLQRTYDQVFHDIAIQGAPVILAIDRAGIVEGDGRTHQGIYDCSFLSGIPGMEIYSPDSYDELRAVFASLFERRTMAAVRYPKGRQRAYDRSAFRACCGGDFYVCDITAGDVPPEDPTMTVVTYGRISAEAYEAALGVCRAAKRGLRLRLIRLCKVYPIDAAALLPYIGGSEALYLLEEGIRSGGIAEKLASGILSELSRVGARAPRTVIHAIEDRFLPHGDILSLFRECGFTAEQLEARFSAVLNSFLKQS